jgi:hypothetical protein
MKRESPLDRLESGTPHGDPSTPKYASLLEATEASLAAMDWLTDADDAAQTLARALAAGIDALMTNRIVQQTDPLAVLKELRMSSPRLLDVLAALGGTPVSRGTFAPKPQGEDEAPADPAAEYLRQFQENAASARGAAA